MNDTCVQIIPLIVKKVNVLLSRQKLVLNGWMVYIASALVLPGKYARRLNIYVIEISNKCVLTLNSRKFF